MAASKKHNVVVIHSDTLRRIGLEHVLASLSEPIIVNGYDSFDTFITSSMEEIYDIAFVESDLLTLYGDYFISRRTKVVPIITNDEPEMTMSEDRFPYVYTKWKFSKLIDKLKGTLAENRRSLKKNDEKGLSLREEEVLKEVARGMTNKEIADRLNISMNTVMSHRKNITSKLNIKTVSGLTFYALINGLITGDEVVDGISE